MDWLQKGASPSDTARAILAYKGVLYKNHLAKGVAKGALTQESADAKFEQWQITKAEKIASKKNQKIQESKSEIKKRLEIEAQVNEAREKGIAEKLAKLNAKKTVEAEPEIEQEPENIEPATEG